MSMPPEASTTSAPETIGNFHHVHPAAPAAPDERIKNDDGAARSEGSRRRVACGDGGVR